MSSYDIPLTVGFDPIKGAAGVIAAIKGFEGALSSAAKYSNEIQKLRVFEILGGDLNRMQTASDGVVTNIQLMGLYTQLAMRGMSGYAIQLATVAGKMHELGMDPESLSKALAGGKLGTLKLFLPESAKSALKDAKTEQERALILIRAFNSEQTKALTGYDLLSDKVEKFSTSLKNLNEGPILSFYKTFGLLGVSITGAAIALKVFAGKTGLGFLANQILWSVRGPLMGLRLSLGRIKDAWNFRNIEGKQGLGFLLGPGSRGIWGLTSRFLGLAAGISLFSGILKGLELGEVVKMIPQFVSGFSIKDNKFMLSPSFIAKIDKVAPNFFRLLGKSIIFASEAGSTFYKAFEFVGIGIGKALGWVGSLFGLGPKLGSVVTAGSVAGFVLITGAVTRFAMSLFKMLGILRYTPTVTRAVIPVLGTLSKGLLGLAMNPFFIVIAAGAIAIDQVARAVGGWDVALKNIAETMRMIGDLDFWKFWEATKALGSNFGEAVGLTTPAWKISSNVGPAMNAEESATMNRRIAENYQRIKENRPTLDLQTGKEAPINVNAVINIDGTKIDTFRAKADRSATAKTIGVK